jgi:hypothetical protein
VSTQPEHDTQVGELDGWLSAEYRAPDLSCSEVVGALSRFFLGYRGVCASWDSGKLDPLPSDMPAWQLNGQHAVSPTVDSPLAASWPGSSCGFDEWYYLDAVPDDVALDALCSWGASVGDAAELRDVPSGFDLLAQLERYQPDAILGDGHRTFLITKDRALLDAFVGESRRRRTRS